MVIKKFPKSLMVLVKIRMNSFFCKTNRWMVFCNNLLLLDCIPSQRSILLTQRQFKE